MKKTLLYHNSHKNPIPHCGELIFLCLVGIFIFCWSCIQPLNSSPDEAMRYNICQYIYTHHTLPSGKTAALQNPLWGYSYAFFPILAYTVGALFMHLASIFTQNAFHLLMAARMVSILCGVGTTYFSLKIGERLWHKTYIWLFACLCIFLPESIFVFSYVNNDSLALFSTSIIVYMWICGIQTNWKYRYCIGLAIGLSLCTLSYYNAYGFLLCSILLLLTALVRSGKKDAPQYLLKGALIAGIVLLLSGWWFVRSYSLYDGDFLGLSTSESYSQLYAIDSLKPSNRITPESQNVSIFYMLFQQKWLQQVIKSFIGCFGYLNIYLTNPIYVFYLLILLAGMLGVLPVVIHYLRLQNKKEKNYNICYAVIFLLSILIPNLLNMYHSYSVDYEAQGRYSLPMLIPLMLLVTAGLKHVINFICRKRQMKLYAVRSVLLLWCGMIFVVYAFIFLPNYVNL